MPRPHFANDLEIMTIMRTVSTNTDNLRDLFLLRTDVVYLNHGSFGACPDPVLEDQQRWRTEMERNPVLFFMRTLQPAIDDARATLARSNSDFPIPAPVGAQQSDVTTPASGSSARNPSTGWPFTQIWRSSNTRSR